MMAPLSLSDFVESRITLLLLLVSPSLSFLTILITYSPICFAPFLFKEETNPMFKAASSSEPFAFYLPFTTSAALFVCQAAQSVTNKGGKRVMEPTPIER
jgi:hypothetical protein